jgi:hypothetical protein
VKIGPYPRGQPISVTQEKYYKTLCFPLSLTSENKNKKQKDIITESKGNNFEHPHTRM